MRRVRHLPFVIALAAALGGCSGPEESALRPLPDERLGTLAGVPGPSLASCPTDRCLTVLVAPWCSVCHGAVPEILALRRWLDAHGVSSRVVVGASADREEIADFAKDFGPDTMLDYEQSLHARSVPLFLVTDRKGRVLKSVGGLPRADGPETLARYLELL